MYFIFFFTRIFTLRIFFIYIYFLRVFLYVFKIFLYMYFYMYFCMYFVFYMFFYIIYMIYSCIILVFIAGTLYFVREATTTAAFECEISRFDHRARRAFFISLRLTSKEKSQKR